MGRLQDRQALWAKVGHGVEAPVPSMPANHGPVQEVRRQTEDRTRSCQLERAEVSCPKCEERQAEESQKLSDCESRCKEINAKNQRLTLALTVVATLAGKESLDFALGLSTTIGSIAAATGVGVPDSVVGLEVVDQDGSLDPTAEASDVEVEKLERAFPTDFVSRHEYVEYFPDAVGSYLPDAAILLSDPNQSLFQAIEQNDLLVNPFVAFGESGQEMLLFDLGLWGDEYTSIPEAGVLPVVGVLSLFVRRKRS